VCFSQSLKAGEAGVVNSGCSTRAGSAPTANSSPLLSSLSLSSEACTSPASSTPNQSDITGIYTAEHYPVSHGCHQEDYLEGRAVRKLSYKFIFLLLSMKYLGQKDIPSNALKYWY
jgi:hypothetical protein